MAQDYALEFGQAVVGALEADPPYAELVPVGSIYGDFVPADRTFPFSRMGSVLAAPFRASGLDSSAFRFSYQAFTKAEFVDDVRTVTAPDRAKMIGSAIKDALDGKTLAIGSDRKLRVTWVQTAPQRDGAEADAWMTTVTFTAEVAG